MYFGNRESASQGSMQLGNKSLGFKATDAVVGWYIITITITITITIIE